MRKKASNMKRFKSILLQRSMLATKQCNKSPAIRRNTSTNNISKNTISTKEQNFNLCKEIQPHLHTFSRFKDNSHHNISSKNSYEIKIEKLIRSGNIDEAENISDKISNQQAIYKIKKALSARNSLIQKTQNNQHRKLSWGFEPKQKWESKSAM